MTDISLDKYTEYFRPYLNVKKNSFIKSIEKIKNMPFRKQPQYIESLIKNGCADGSGFYSSSDLEKILLAHSEDLDCNIDPIEYKQNHFLHVMTEAYFSGGHTRVVERWIEQSPLNEIHHIFFTSDNLAELPKRLENAVIEKNGTITFTSKGDSILDKAKKLRIAAAAAQYVILHIHPYDTVPIIAFGTEKFNRPIIYYNHADNLFWLGISVADTVADLKTLGQNITLNRRKALNSFVLGIPTEKTCQKIKYDKSLIRKELSLPPDKKIILTYGMIHKYKPILDFNFFNYAQEMLKDENIMMIMIGPKANEIKRKINTTILNYKNFKLINRLPHNELIKYICSADLVADSFPMVGGTAMIDAINYDAPVVTVKDFVGQMDYIINSPAYCENITELIDKSKRLLYNETAAKEHIKALKLLVQNYNEPHVFKEKLNNLYNITPNRHKIYPFSSDSDFNFSPCDVFAYYSTTAHKTFKFFGLKFTLTAFKNYLNKKEYHFVIESGGKLLQLF